MRVQIIYLTRQDKKQSSIANEIASNVRERLQSLLIEMKEEKAAIFIYFGKGDSKIEIKASPKLERAISILL